MVPVHTGPSLHTDSAQGAMNPSLLQSSTILPMLSQLSASWAIPGHPETLWLSGGTLSVLLLCRLCIFLKTLKHSTLNMNPVAQQIPEWLLAQALEAEGSGTHSAGDMAGSNHLLL